MVKIKQKAQHPGYAPNELKDHGIFGVFTDVFSFGTCAYVLYHGEFYQGEKALNGLDKILVKCMSPQYEKRPQSMKIMNRKLRYIKKAKTYGFKDILLHLILFSFCIILILCAFTIQKDSRFHEAFVKKDYKKALQIYPDRIEVYQSLYQEYMNLYNDEMIALQLMDEDIISFKQVQNKEILLFYIQKCIESEHSLYYQKAFDKLDILPNSMLSEELFMYKNILTLFISKNNHSTTNDNSLDILLKDSLEWAITQDNKNAYRSVLHAFHIQMSQVSDDGIQTILHTIKETYVELVEKSQYYEIYEILWDVYYEFGMRMYEKRNYNAMQNCFQESSFLFNIVILDDSKRRSMAFINFLVVMYGEVDEETARVLLKQASDCLIEIVDKTPFDISQIEKIKGMFI